MTDTASLLLSLVAVFWVIVRAVMLDPLRPWIERLLPRGRAGSREPQRAAAPWETMP